MEKIEATPEEVIINHIAESELVWAAITESVHRYYYDNALDKNRDKKAVVFASKLLSNLWCLFPNWRFILKLKADRYKCDDKKMTDVLLLNKPKEIIKAIIDIKFEPLNNTFS